MIQYRYILHFAPYLLPLRLTPRWFCGISVLMNLTNKVMKISTSEFNFYNNAIIETRQVSNFEAKLAPGKEKDFILQIKEDGYYKFNVHLTLAELKAFAQTGRLEGYAFWHSMNPNDFLKIIDQGRIFQKVGISQFLQ